MHHPKMGYENLHRHSDYSLLDGFSTVEEYAIRMREIDQKFLCITDHGVMGAVPQQVLWADNYTNDAGEVKPCSQKLFPLFGCEIYVNQMQFKANNRAEITEYRRSLGDGTKEVTEAQKKFDKNSHLLAIAYTNEGYSNLVRMTSWAWIHGYYRRPRVNHDVLRQHKEGILFTSTCANSEIANAFFAGGDDAGFEMLETYIDMFGGDHFYLEMMMLDFVLQKPYNQFLIRAHEKYHLPMIMSQDCFVPGTLVLTHLGFKSVEDVVVGDVVLTHLGKWREVEVVGSRLVRPDEKVYQVKTRVGTYAYEATGNHEVYVAQRAGKEWQKSWKETRQLSPGEDFLLIPKISADAIFASNDLTQIDLMPFLADYDFQIGDRYESSQKGNMSCRLQYNEESQEFWSYRGWDRKCKTVVPRHFTVDDDFLKVLGWYIAEGWSEKKSNQVGFALHKDEQSVADWLIQYFAKFGIEAKTYRVSDNGIAVRFSSVVFNRFLGTMCGYGAAHKHLPRPDHSGWMKNWSKKQLLMILSRYWQGDGSGSDDYINFASTSKNLMFEIAIMMNGMGMFAYPSCEEPRKSTWSDKWSITVAKAKTDCIHDWFSGSELDFSDPRVKGTKYFDIGDHYAVSVVSLGEIDNYSQVYCFRVSEDHSFTANLYGVSNCHYCKKEHSHNQRLMLMQKNGRTIQEINALIQSGEADDLFELQDQNLWLKSEDELNEKWESDFKDTIDYEIYKQAKANTVIFAERAKGVQIDRSVKLPKIPDAEVILWEETKKGFVQRHCPKTDEYFKRIREEYDLICEKGFASYFLIQKMMTDEARKEGPKILGFGDGSECVGPGRGSVCGSLLAYVLRLHDVEPIIHGLRFSRFLSPARGGKQMKIRHTLRPIPHGEVV